VLVNGLEFHVDVDGEGQPLLLLHGFTGSVRNWDLVRGRLLEHYRLILVDLIGHGQSPSPGDSDRYTLEWAVRDLVGVLDGLELPRADVLGYSMGGRLALRLAIDAPERVRTLLLESASPGIADSAERLVRSRADEELAARIERDGVAAFVGQWEQQPLLALAAHVPPDIRAAQHEQRLRNTRTGLANSLRGGGAGRQTPLWDRLGALRLPVRLIVGERDSRYCAIARRMIELLPKAELSVCQQAGHTVHLDQPTRFVEWAIA
jgi:2-succinyl-6-hydroxy-2,4-cyclohexadiene-1-carboxylate synthase